MVSEDDTAPEDQKITLAVSDFAPVSVLLLLLPPRRPRPLRPHPPPVHLLLVLNIVPPPLPLHPIFLQSTMSRIASSLLPLTLAQLPPWSSIAIHVDGRQVPVDYLSRAHD
eukprot:338226-Hanusia_phi.AAC.1